MKVNMDIDQAIELVIRAINNGKGDVAVAILRDDLLPVLRDMEQIAVRCRKEHTEK